MPLIGSVDIFIGTLSLLFPCPAVFAYAVFWGAWTAFLRPLTGLGWWEFFERAGNFGVPLSVLALYLFADSTKKIWFKPSFPRLDSDRQCVVVARVLQVTTILLLLGHAGLALGQRKALLAHHMGTLTSIMGSQASDQSLLKISGLLDLILMLTTLCCPASIIFLLAVFWKIFIESLYPLSGDYIWEFIERFGSYIAPLALFAMAREKPLQFYLNCLSLKNFGRWLVTQHQNGFYRSATLSLALGGLLFLLVGFSLNHHSEVAQYSLSVLKPKEVKFLSGPQLLGEMTTQPALIYFRHFPTQDDSRRNDTKQWLHGRLTLGDFKNCSWQRELHPFGQELAQSVGTQFAKLSLKIKKVLSSPYCRCIETAQLLTGLNPALDLGLIYRRAEHTPERMEHAFQSILLNPENFSPGMLTVVVGHRPGVDAFGEIAEGDAVVFIGFDHGVGHPLLFLCDAKAYNSNG
jgi:phosphohistidine phosphatase SixA